MNGGQAMNEITVYTNALTVDNEAIRNAGMVANHYADQTVFSDYLSRKAQNTIDSQRTDLKTFCDYLLDVGVTLNADALQNNPNVWTDVTYGLVEGFVKWLLAKGYATSSINRKLSTIKVYTKLAYKAGTIDTDTNAKIRIVSGYSGKDATNIDNKRDVTRLTNKKEESNFLSPKQYKELVALQRDNNVGLRNKVVLGLLFEYGLRVSEVVQLPLANIDIDNGRMTVYRHKTGETTNFDLLVTPDFYRLLKQYMNLCNSTQYYLMLPATQKTLLDPTYDDNGNVQPLSRIAVQRWLTRQGKRIGIDKLTPHDARHTALQLLLEQDLNDSVIMDFFGWRTRNMIDQYRQQRAVANKGISVM